MIATKRQRAEPDMTIPSAMPFNCSEFISSSGRRLSAEIPQVRRKVSRAPGFPEAALVRRVRRHFRNVPDSDTHALMAASKSNLLFLISDCWYGSCVRGTNFGSARRGHSDGSPHIPTRRSGSLARSHVRGVLRLGTDGVAIAERDDRRAVRAG